MIVFIVNRYNSNIFYGGNGVMVAFRTVANFLKKFDQNRSTFSGPVYRTPAARVRFPVIALNTVNLCFLKETRTTGGNIK